MPTSLDLAAKVAVMALFAELKRETIAELQKKLCDDPGQCRESLIVLNVAESTNSSCVGTNHWIDRVSEIPVPGVPEYRFLTDLDPKTAVVGQLHLFVQPVVVADADKDGIEYVILNYQSQRPSLLTVKESDSGEKEVFGIEGHGDPIEEKDVYYVVFARKSGAEFSLVREVYGLTDEICF